MRWQVVVVLALVVQVLTSTSVHPAPAGLKDWVITDAGIQLTVDLDDVRGRLKQEVTTQTGSRVSLPDFEWFNFRFSKLRVGVDDVDVTAGHAANEATLAVRGGIEARRERRKYNVVGPWEADGGKRVARLSAAARLRVDATDKEVRVVVLGDALRIESELNPINGLAASVQLNGVTLLEQRFALQDLLPKEIAARVRIVNARLALVDKTTARVDLDIKVP